LPSIRNEAFRLINNSEEYWRNSSGFDIWIYTFLEFKETDENKHLFEKQIQMIFID
jgi:hypothetical protein